MLQPCAHSRAGVPAPCGVSGLGCGEAVLVPPCSSWGELGPALFQQQRFPAHSSPHKNSTIKKPLSQRHRRSQMSPTSSCLPVVAGGARRGTSCVGPQALPRHFLQLQVLTIMYCSLFLFRFRNLMALFFETNSCYALKKIFKFL